ncbi:unnamed protein product, partial [Brassica oleracea]
SLYGGERNECISTCLKKRIEEDEFAIYTIFGEMKV